MHHTRRDFLRLSALGGIVFASGLGARALGANGMGADDFYFVQLSDTHWGFDGAAVNPDAKGTLAKAVAAVNALDDRPDFVVFTGDLTHVTDDPRVRRERMKQFRDVASKLSVKQVYYLAGEHDAAADRGEAYQELFGKLYYSFDHKGVHFVALDNVSDPGAIVGEQQIAWLKSDLARVAKTTPVVVLTHRPLFDLYPSWDWATRDAQAVVDTLTPFDSATVFYGHIHQENHHMTGHVAHHAATSVMFPLPAAGSVPKKAPVPWDPTQPYKGLGFRSVDASAKAAKFSLEEHTLAGIPAPSAAATAAAATAAPADARVVKIEAKRYLFSPSQVTLKRGVPVVLEVATTDVQHGFDAPDFDLHAEIKPGEVARLNLTPTKTGTFTFFCSVYCGSGHEDMSGTIVVTD